MESRHFRVWLFVVGCLAVSGCSSETTADGEDWTFSAGERKSPDAGSSGGLDALANLDGDVADRPIPPSSSEPLELEGTTWRRYSKQSPSPIPIFWETFRADGTISKYTERNDEKNDRNPVPGEWSVQPSGDVQITYREEGEKPLTFVQPRIGFESEPGDLWFEVPERERERDEMVVWSPYVYIADDAETPRTFTGRAKVDFSPRPPAFDRTLRSLRVRLAFESLDDDGDACSVEFQITARARWAATSPCEVSRSFERQCRVTSADGPFAQMITLGYGETLEKARANWREVEFERADRESCREAVVVAHTSFNPVLYRLSTRPDVLVSAVSDRWIRYRTPESPPGSTDGG